jgi:NDP-sugar pyrophosphorylase family protein
VSDSILGNEVNLGAGAKCANLRFDRKPISIYCDGHKIETGLNKMGAILGDHAQMGCNSVANPGTLLLPKMTCPPCANIRGFCNEQS